MPRDWNAKSAPWEKPQPPWRTVTTRPWVWCQACQQSWVFCDRIKKGKQRCRCGQPWPDAHGHHNPDVPAPKLESDKQGDVLRTLYEKHLSDGNNKLAQAIKESYPEVATEPAKPAAAAPDVLEITRRLRQAENQRNQTLENVKSLREKLETTMVRLGKESDELDAVTRELAEAVRAKGPPDPEPPAAEGVVLPTLDGERFSKLDAKLKERYAKMHEELQTLYKEAVDECKRGQEPIEEPPAKHARKEKNDDDMEDEANEGEASQASASTQENKDAQLIQQAKQMAKEALAQAAVAAAATPVERPAAERQRG